MGTVTLDLEEYNEINKNIAFLLKENSKLTKVLGAILWDTDFTYTLPHSLVYRASTIIEHSALGLNIEDNFDLELQTVTLVGNDNQPPMFQEEGSN